MLGPSHLAVGAAGYLAIAAPLYSQLGRELTPGELLAGTIVSAGAAMLPDLDHPQATAARALGPVSQLASRIIRFVARGHRMGTHTLLAAALVLIGSTAVVVAAGEHLWVPILLCALPIALCARIVLERYSDLVGLVVALICGAGLLAIAPGTDWIPIALTTGYLLHLLADAITVERVPLLYPFSGRRFGPGLFRTGTRPEHLVAAVCVIAIVPMLWLGVLAPVFAERGQSLGLPTAHASTPQSTPTPADRPTP